VAIEVGNGKARRVRPVMNVTPLVDVVLVLLIIFMVITPLLAKQFSTNVPIKDDPNQPPPPPNAGAPPVVLAARSAGHLEINGERIAPESLAERIPRLLAAQPEPVLFFTADDDVPHGRAVEAMDQARAAGAKVIAIITEKLETP
jgi:biopolymer transport protein ExbD/biopolymer transport protein TolR